MHRHFTTLATLTILLVAPLHLAANEALSLSAAMESIAKGDLSKHVETLADDALEGRAAGTRGGYAAAKYIQGEFVRIGLEPAGEDDRYTQLFNAGYRNLLGILPGSDEKLRREVILVGAHFDHVGYGTWTNSRGPIGYIHNGADDNASGTSAVLEIAEAF
ncbi:MAG: M28 family peptidase, partial [Pirellulales bacterium]|nr:M28 family peptidase [Pirellulales bacterium]